MHPPFLKSIAGRRKTERFKGCTETWVVQQARKGSTNALFLRTLGITDTNARKVTQLTLK
jgi:hypothetical protein